MAMTDDSAFAWLDASTDKPPCNGWYVVSYRRNMHISTVTEVLRWSGQDWINASYIVSQFIGPFASMADARLFMTTGTVPNSGVYSPDKHRLALKALKELASLCGNPGRTANKLLEIVGELLEIE
jgi:hypothetical protein